MFGFSFGEILLLSAIALIAIGPKQIPEVARTIGKLMAEVRRATADFQRAFNQFTDTANTHVADLNRTLDQAVRPPEPNPHAQAQPYQAPNPTHEVNPSPTTEVAAHPAFDTHANSDFNSKYGPKIENSQEPPALDDAQQMSFELDAKSGDKSSEKKES